MSCDLCQPLPGLLWQNDELAVIAIDDAAHPGFCRVVWKAHVKEMTDLAAEQRARFMEVVWLVEAALREVMQPEKINIASLGNMTPHLHWHLIPRFVDDAQFPNPVWVAALRSTDAAVLDARRAKLPQLALAITRRLPA